MNHGKPDNFGESKVTFIPHKNILFVNSEALGTFYCYTFESLRCSFALLFPIRYKIDFNCHSFRQ